MLQFMFVNVRARIKLERIFYRGVCVHIAMLLLLNCNTLALLRLGIFDQPLPYKMGFGVCVCVCNHECTGARARLPTLLHHLNSHTHIVFVKISADLFINTVNTNHNRYKQ